MLWKVGRNYAKCDWKAPWYWDILHYKRKRKLGGKIKREILFLIWLATDNDALTNLCDFVLGMVFSSCCDISKYFWLPCEITVACSRST